MAPLPIIICGKNPNIAKVVREGLMPDFEGIAQTFEPFISIYFLFSSLPRAAPLQKRLMYFYVTCLTSRSNPRSHRRPIRRRTNTTPSV